MAESMAHDRYLNAGTGGRRERRHTPTRIVLGALTTLVSVNMWTLVGATVGVLIVETLVLYKLLAVLSARYDHVIGRTRRRQQAPWLKPMTGERRSIEVRQPLSAVEKIVVISVVAAVLCFEVWFFFFAHYKLPG